VTKKKLKGPELENHGQALGARHTFLPHEGNEKGTPGDSQIKRLFEKFEIGTG